MTLQETFINRVLTAAGSRMVKNQGDAIKSAVSDKATGYLLRNRFATVSGTTLKFEHPIYERFLDIKVLQRNGRKIKRKPLHIHNRFMFGHYLSIAKHLMYDLTEDVAESIKQELTLKHFD